MVFGLLSKDLPRGSVLLFLSVGLDPDFGVPELRGDPDLEFL